MILRTQDGEIAEDANTRGWWLARLAGDADFTAGFQCRIWAAGWLRAAAFARAHGLPMPPVPAVSTGPLFAPEPFVERIAR